MMKRWPTIFGMIIIIGLLIPISQQLLGFIYIRPLHGVTEPDTTKISYSWWNRDLQKRLDAYATDSLSLHPACVRLRNQFEYTFFDKLNALDIYEHQGIFYRYTHATYNEANAYVGDEKIQRQVHLLAHYQELLHQDRIPIYVLITPSKLHYYKKQLPTYNQTNSQRTNYIQYKKTLEKAGIHVLDADAWFLKEKHKQSIRLFATGGAHWTLFGGTLAMDSLIKRINHDRSTDFQRVTYEVSTENKIYAEDMDIVGLSNLLFPPEDHQLRLIHFPTPKTLKKRLKPVVISDSFFNVVSWTPLHDQVLDPETAFYYYFHTRFTQQTTNPKFTNTLVQQDIQKADCIIIITDIQNMEQFGFGFIEQYVQKALLKAE